MLPSDLQLHTQFTSRFGSLGHLNGHRIADKGHLGKQKLRERSLLQERRTFRRARGNRRFWYEDLERDRAERGRRKK